MENTDPKKGDPHALIEALVGRVDRIVEHLRGHGLHVENASGTAAKRVPEPATDTQQAAIQQMLKDNPGSEAGFAAGRSSGSPLHLVAAQAAADEAAKNAAAEDTNKAEPTQNEKSNLG